MGSSASATGISSHRDGLRLLLDVLEELDGAGQLPAIDSLGGLAGVLEGNSEVRTAGASRLRGLDLGGSVSNLETREKAVVSPSSNFSISPPGHGYFLGDSTKKLVSKTGKLRIGRSEVSHATKTAAVVQDRFKRTILAAVLWVVS